MSNLNIGHYKTRLDEKLYSLIQTTTIPAPTIKAALEYSLFPGGKRLRPLLVYLWGEILAISLETLDIIAMAVELIHSYSLLHDDLPAMDNDNFRRGKPSCHRAFDEATAILTGDGMQALAIELLFSNLVDSLNPQQIIAIARELVQASGIAGMVSGQSLDLTDMGQLDVQESHLQEIYELKTGALLMACINMVIYAGQPDNKTQTAMREFAKHLGYFFQIQDDYLDKYAPETLGKDRASDSANGKKTFTQFYNQQALADLITNHYQQAEQILLQFGNAADKIHELLRSLHRRI